MKKLEIIAITSLILIPKSYATEDITTIWIAEKKSEFAFAIHSALLDKISDTKKLDFRLNEYGRALIDYKSQKPTCLFNRRVSKIFQDASYSLPITKYESRELFFRIDLSHDIRKITDDTGRVSLLKIFENYPDRVLMIGEGLTYGDELDEEIKKIPPNNIYLRAPSGHAGAYINMLEKERIDYLIEYPISFRTPKHIHGRFSSFKISESPFIIGHLVCNKATPKEVIGQYNKAIADSKEALQKIHNEFGFKI